MDSFDPLEDSINLLFGRLAMRHCGLRSSCTQRCVQVLFDYQRSRILLDIDNVRISSGLAILVLGSLKNGGSKGFIGKNSPEWLTEHVAGD